MIASYPSEHSLGAWDELEECIVNAENALEQAACRGATASEKVLTFMRRRASEFQSLRVAPPDECMLEAENALEQSACFEATVDDVLECVVYAESAEERSMCAEAPSFSASSMNAAIDHIAAASTSLAAATFEDVAHFEECVVDAENAAELASCWEAVTPIAPTTGPLHRARRVVTFPIRLFKKAVYNVHAYNL